MNIKIGQPSKPVHKEMGKVEINKPSMDMYKEYSLPLPDL